MDKEAIQFMVVLTVMVGFLSFVFSYTGEKTVQQEVEQRALKLKQKDCYDWKDIEFIIHGETQE